MRSNNNLYNTDCLSEGQCADRPAPYYLPGYLPVGRGPAPGCRLLATNGEATEAANAPHGA